MNGKYPSIISKPESPPDRENAAVSVQESIELSYPDASEPTGGRENPGRVGQLAKSKDTPELISPDPDASPEGASDNAVGVYGSGESDVESAETVAAEAEKLSAETICADFRRPIRRLTDKLYPLAALGVLLIVWELISYFEVVPRFMLPSPVQMLQALYTDAPVLAQNALTTLLEAVAGLLIGVAAGYLAAVVMDNWDGAYKAIYPLIVVTQTIPTVAIAPLLVLWFGYDMKPKIILIILCTFFPVAVGVLDGFRSADPDAVSLLRAMGATKGQIFRHIKIPGALPHFFSGLRISAAYAIVGAVLAEWLGGFRGLGVYMIRVKKSFAYDRMFAVILLISIISLLLLWLINLIQKRCMPWDSTLELTAGQEDKSGN